MTANLSALHVLVGGLQSEPLPPHANARRLIDELEKRSMPNPFHPGQILQPRKETVFSGQCSTVIVVKTMESQDCGGGVGHGPHLICRVDMIILVRLASGDFIETKAWSAHFEPYAGPVDSN